MPKTTMTEWQSLDCDSGGWTPKSLLCVKVTKFGRHPSPQPPGDAWVWGKERKGRTREAYSGYASPV